MCKEEIVVGKFDVVVVSYEALLKESSKMLKFRWKYVGRGVHASDGWAISS